MRVWTGVQVSFNYGSARCEGDEKKKVFSRLVEAYICVINQPG